LWQLSQPKRLKAGRCASPDAFTQKYFNQQNIPCVTDSADSPCGRNWPYVGERWPLQQRAPPDTTSFAPGRNL